MAALILPSRRVVQPQGPVEIDRGSPLTAGIQFAYIPAFSRFSSVNNAGFQGGSAVFGAATTGQGIAYPTPPVFLGSLSQSTILAVGSTRAVTGGGVGQIGSGGDAIFSERGSSGSDIYKIGLVAVDTLSAEFVYRNDAGNLLQQRVQCVGLNDGRKIAISATKNGTTHRVGINGVFSSGTIGNASTAFTNATLTRQIGADLADTAAAWNGYVDVVAGWDRALSVAEINALTDNPWQLFRPIQRRIWVPVAGGGGISQTVAFTLEDVSASVSQNLSHAQSLTGTLDDVTVSISQTVQHSQALSATLDDIAFAASQTLGNATNQTLAITLDGVTVAAAQTLSHSQSLDAALDGVTVSASQTLSHSQALAATLDGITVAINQSAAPSSKEQSLAVVLDGIQVAIAQEGPASLIDTHDGFWAKEWARIRAREKRKYQEEIQERVEEIQDEIAEVEQQIVEVKQAPKPKKATPARDFYAEQARIVEHLIARRNQLIDEEDEELLLLL